MIEGYSDDDLAFYACSEKDVSAVISMLSEDVVTSGAMVHATPQISTGRVRTRTEAKLVGRAIRYVPTSVPTLQTPSPAEVSQR